MVQELNFSVILQLLMISNVYLSGDEDNEKVKEKKLFGTSGSNAIVGPEMTIEDEAWRSYLENDSAGLTIASSDEDTAGALATLYEYYKVPFPDRKRTKSNSISISPGTSNHISHRSKAVVNIVGAQAVTKLIKVEPKSNRGFNLSELAHERGSPIGIRTNSNFTPTTVGSSTSAVTIAKATITTKASAMSPCPSTSDETSFSPSSSIVHNMENPDDMFHYSMEAPKSLKQNDKEPTMSYINKGQYYCITLRAGNDWVGQTSTRVSSIVSVVFGDGKPEAEQLKHWKYWHSRQHTTKQRVIDIADYKESAMVSNIHEFSHNAISFRWDTDQHAKIFIAVNCLSTDFSAQKGIKVRSPTTTSPTLII